MTLLTISNLDVSVENTKILNSLSLSVKKGEIHAIMGPNGAGKSTLTKVIAGHPDYEITSGDITLDGSSILEDEVQERSHKGIFIGYQYPLEIEGVKNIDLLFIAVNSQRKYQNLPEYTLEEFTQKAVECVKELDFDVEMLERGVNAGFSGGEKKKNEILQMKMLSPTLAVLDETDSGLDIDALKVVSRGINSYASKDTAVVIITHYKRLLEYVKPDRVHIMIDGAIVESGGIELCEELEANGYQRFSGKGVK
jgi:Fe-S cluster assembly ATP-binding protein